MGCNETDGEQKDIDFRTQQRKDRDHTHRCTVLQ